MASCVYCYGLLCFKIEQLTTFGMTAKIIKLYRFWFFISALTITKSGQYLYDIP